MLPSHGSVAASTRTVSGERDIANAVSRYRDSGYKEGTSVLCKQDCAVTCCVSFMPVISHMHVHPTSHPGVEDKTDVLNFSK